MSLEIQVYTGGPCACNGYFVRGTKSYVAIDAPLGFAEWAKKKLPAEAKVTDLLITHQHFDHVQGVAAMVRQYGCRVHACMAYSTALTLEDLARHSWGGGFDVEPFKVDNVFVDKAFKTADVYGDWGGLNWTVHHIPGHSPDGVAYELPEHEELFCGDILFAGSVGRTDFPGGSMNSLVRGIREKLLLRPHTTVVHSGHGPDTTLAEESLNNPYL